MDAASAYLAGLQVRGLGMEIFEGRLRIPPGHTSAEVDLVRLLKPELMKLVVQAPQGGLVEHTAIQAPRGAPA